MKTAQEIKIGDVVEFEPGTACEGENTFFVRRERSPISGAVVR